MSKLQITWSDIANRCKAQMKSDLGNVSDNNVSEMEEKKGSQQQGNSVTTKEAELHMEQVNNTSGVHKQGSSTAMVSREMLGTHKH